MRTGTEALSLLTAPLNVEVLTALGEEPTPLHDLRQAVGHPPVTTMRSYLRRLTETGVLERYREDDFPGSVSYSLAKPGKKLLAVAGVLCDWLQMAPVGTLELGGRGSKSAVKALLDGWDAGIVRALAARPLALTELDRLIPQISYPALERRLTAMRQVGLIEPDPNRNGRVARCQVTEWLRRGVAPLTAAVGWEAVYLQDRTPAPSPLDAEAILLLAVPLSNLPSDASGTCRFAVQFRRGTELSFAGVMVDVADGEIRSCVTRLEGQPDAWATASVLDWFRWLRLGDDQGVETGGDVRLARALEGALRDALAPVG
ncbi:MAG TPA: winged helix-turn-helix transcriptional regulator [Solirubrobacterales bacterium]|nr:winged helix-turn-helix transcriptional regulator [Solirubrobacterales bacterium]